MMNITRVGVDRDNFKKNHKNNYILEWFSRRTRLVVSLVVNLRLVVSEWKSKKIRSRNIMPDTACNEAQWPEVSGKLVDYVASRYTTALFTYSGN